MSRPAFATVCFLVGFVAGALVESAMELAGFLR